jgi:plasmid stabilization system protein ParE
MKVRFTLEALTHIAGIRFYIEQRSPQAAIHIAERIFAEADRLGVHELDEDSDEVIVVGVFHGSQAR